MPSCKDTTRGKDNTQVLLSLRGGKGFPVPRRCPMATAQSVRQGGAATLPAPPRSASPRRLGPGSAPAAVPGQRRYSLALLFLPEAPPVAPASRGRERLGARSGFPRAACCGLRRRQGPPFSQRFPPPRDGQLREPVKRLAPPRCGCKEGAASGAGTNLEDPVEEALIGGRERRRG